MGGWVLKLGLYAGAEGTLIISIPRGNLEMKRKLRTVMKKHQVHCHEVAHGRMIPSGIWINGVECSKHKFVVSHPCIQASFRLPIVNGLFL